MARTRSMIAVLIVASLTLMLYDLRTQDDAVRSLVNSVSEPLQRTVTAVLSPLGEWVRQVQDFDDPVARQADAAAIAGTIEVPAGFAAVPGRAVSADVTLTRAYVGIDVGAGDGVQLSNAVIGPNGLVGSIVSVTDDSAWVRLLTDPDSAVGVRLATSDEMAVVSGRGAGNPLAVQILNPGANPVAGEPLVSLGEMDPKGIPADLPVATLTGVDPDLPAAGRAATAQSRTSLTAVRDVVVLTVAQP